MACYEYNGIKYTESELRSLLTKEQPKTRRILEVQSDWGQKQRNAFKSEDYNYFSQKDAIDKNKIQYSRYKSGQEIEHISKQEYEKAWNKYLDTYENPKDAFGKLLLRDANWVNFFIKSIISDSAKKGYENVLFPTGDIASKIEGHTTLEEFKKIKKDRIEELNKKLKELSSIKVEKTGDFYNFKLQSGITSKYADANSSNVEIELNKYKEAQEKDLNREKEQLKQELKNIETEGFGALKPIYNFYENQVQNILKKLYRDRFERIKDEYGNDWFKISIDPKDRQHILLSKEDSKGTQIPKASNGKESKLYRDLLEHTKDEKLSKIIWDKTQTNEFKNWFKDSKIVDENNEPKLVYHGTPYKFDKFDTSKSIQYEDFGMLFVGIHFAERIETAEQASKNKLEEAIIEGTLDKKEDAHIIKNNFNPRVTFNFLSLKNPKTIDDVGFNHNWDRYIKEAKNEGFDGFIYKNKFESITKEDTYVVFKSDQIYTLGDNQSLLHEANKTPEEKNLFSPILLLRKIEQQELLRQEQFKEKLKDYLYSDELTSPQQINIVNSISGVTFGGMVEALLKKEKVRVLDNKKQLYTKFQYREKLVELEKRDKEGTITPEQIKQRDLLKIILRQEVWDKIQQEILNNLESMGYAIKDGVAIGQEEGIHNNTIKQEQGSQSESLSKEDNFISNSEESGEESLSGRGSGLSEMSYLTLRLKDTMSTHLKVWLGAISSGDESMIPIGSNSNTFVNIDTVINNIYEATKGKRLLNELIQGLEETAAKIPARAYLKTIADKLKKEQEAGTKIASEFVTKFNGTGRELILVKLDAKPRELEKNVFEKDENGDIVYDVHNQIINVNRNDIPKNLIENWNTEFGIQHNVEGEEGLEVDPKSYNTISEEYNNFKKDISKYFDSKTGKLNSIDTRDIAKTKIADILSKIGINLSPLALSNLIDGKIRRQDFSDSKNASSVFNKKYGILSTIFDNFNPVVGNSDAAFNSTGIKKLATEESNHLDYYMNTSSTDGKGRNIWAYGLHNPFTREFWKVINSSNSDKTYIQDLLGNHYNSQSSILNALNTRTGEDLENYINSFSYTIFNITKSSQKTNEGKELKNMTENEFINSQVQLFTSSGKSTENQKWSYKFLTTPSDKTTMFMVKTPDHNISLDTKTLAEVQPITVNAFYNYFLGEYKRVKAYTDGTSEYKHAWDIISTAEPRLFYHFGVFNTKSNFLWKQNEKGEFILRDLDEQVNGISVSTYVRDKIKEQVNQDIEQTRYDWNEFNLINNGKFVNGFNKDYFNFVPDNISLKSKMEAVSKKINETRLNDKLSAQVKDTLIEQFHSERANIREQSDKNLTNYLVADFAVNTQLHNIEMHMLALGDPIGFLKSSKQKLSKSQFETGNLESYTNLLNKIRDNISKRMAGVQAQGTEGSGIEKPNEHIGVIVLEDNEIPSKIIEELRKFDKDLSIKYESLAIMDGQEIVMPEEDLRIKYEWGKIDRDTYKTLSDKLKLQHEDMEKQGFVSDSNLFTQEEGLIAQTQKPVIYANILDKFLKANKTTYYKSSAFALYPQFTQGLELDKLRESIYNHNKTKAPIHRIAVSSATKLGALGPIKGVFNPDLTLNTSVLENIPEELIDRIPKEYFRIQMEVPFDEHHDEIKISTQMVKMVFGEVLDSKFDTSDLDLGNKSMTGQELRDYHDDLYKQTFNLAYDQFLEDTGATDNQDGTYTFDDIEKLNKKLTESAISLGYTPNAIDGLKLTENKKGFVIPLAFSSNPDKYEKLLLSLINNIIDQDMHGRSLILATEQGFKPTKKPELIEGKAANDWINYNKSSIIFTDKFDPSVGLLPQRPDLKDPTKTLPAQLMMSWSFKDSKGNTLDINDYIKEKDGHKFIDLSKLDKDILRVLPLKIPVQGHPNMSHAEIVGFLPHLMGDMLIAPQDYTRQMGTDFDIDKLYTYMYNTFVAKNGNIKKFEFTEQEEDKLRYSFDKSEKVLDKNLSTISDSLTDFFEEGKLISREDFEKKIRERKRKDLHNKMQDIYHTILSSADVYRNMLQGVDEGKLSEVAKKLKEINPKQDTELPSMSSGRYKTYEYFENASGKLGVGVYSVNNTFYNLIEGREIELSRALTDSEKKDLENQKSEIPTHVSDPFLFKDSQGNTKSISKLAGHKGWNKIISIFQSASVDNAKLKLLSDLNINKYTMGVTALMASLANNDIKENGEPIYDEEYIALFINQPEIKNYLNLLKEADTNYKIKQNSNWKAELRSKAVNEVYQDILGIVGEDNIPQDISIYPGFSKDELWNGIKKEGDRLQQVITQFHTLIQFQKFEDITDKIRQIQYIINSDSKGAPATIQEAIFKKDNLKNLNSDSLSNLDRIFQNKDGSKTLASNFFKLGVELPASIYKGNSETPPILPYSTDRYESFLRDIKNLQNKQDGSNFNSSFASTVWNSFLSYQWSYPDFNIADGNIPKEREKLLTDKESSKSLATQIKEFQKSELFKENPILKPLINSLKIRQDKKNKNIQFVEFSSTVGLVNPETEIILSLEHLRNINYSLFEDLVKYTLLVPTAKAPTSLRRFIPNFYLDGIGLSDRLRTINNTLNSDINSNNLSIDPEVFPRITQIALQTFQHNPWMAQSFDPTKIIFNNKSLKNEFTINRGEGFKEFYHVFENKTIPFQLIQFYDPEKFRNRLYLLHSTDRHLSYVYKEIDTLGVPNLSEYDASGGNLPKSSILSRNKAPESTSKDYKKTGERKILVDEDVKLFNDYVSKIGETPEEFFTSNTKFKEFYNPSTSKREKMPQSSSWILNSNNTYDLVDKQSGEVYISNVDLSTGKQIITENSEGNIPKASGLSLPAESILNRNKAVKGSKITQEPIINTTPSKILNPYPGVINIPDTGLTTKESNHFIDILQPQILNQAYVENKAYTANRMFSYGLRWAKNIPNDTEKSRQRNQGLQPRPNKVNIKSISSFDGYGYYNTDQNDKSLPDIKELQPIIDFIESKLGIDMKDYDSVLANIYEPNSFIHQHRDITESITAKNYPVIVINLGADGGLIYHTEYSDENKVNPNANTYSQFMTDTTKHANLPIKNGGIYAFGIDGINRFTFNHRVKADTQNTPTKPLVVPEWNSKGDKIGEKQLNNYRITLTFRRAQDLTSNIPTTPEKITTDLGNKPPKTTEVIDNDPGTENRIHLNNWYGYDESKSGEVNIVSILNNIKYNSKKPGLRALAELFLAVNKEQKSFKGVNLKLSNEDKYESSNNTISIDTTRSPKDFEKSFEYALTHEIGHQLTKYKMSDGSEISRIINKSLDDLISELERPENLEIAIKALGLSSTPEELKSKLEKLREEQSKPVGESDTRFSSEEERAILNPLINRYELVASLMNDEKTQDIFSKIPYKSGIKDGFFGKFWDILRGLFNNLLKAVGLDKLAKGKALWEGLDSIMKILHKEPGDSKIDEGGSKLTPITPEPKNDKTAEQFAKREQIRNLQQRKEVILRQINSIDADKSKTLEEKIAEKEPLWKREAIVRNNIETLITKYNIENVVNIGNEELNNAENIINSPNVNIDDLAESINIIQAYEKLYRELRAEYKDVVNPELLQEIERLQQRAATMNNRVANQALREFTSVANSVSNRQYTENDLTQSIPNSNPIAASYLNALQSHNPISRITAKILADNSIKRQDDLIEHKTYDSKFIDRFEKIAKFDDLLDTREIIDPETGLKRTVKNFKTRYNSDKFFNASSEIYQKAKSLKGATKHKFINNNLNKIQFTIDLRYLHPEDFNSEMGSELITKAHQDQFHKSLDDFFAKEYPEYGKEYQDYRKQDLINQAERQYQRYKENKDREFNTIDNITELGEVEKATLRSDWLAYNSPHHILNERYSLSPNSINEPIQKPHSNYPPKISEVDERGKRKTVPNIRKNPVTGAFEKIRVADSYIKNKARRKNFNTTNTGFISDEYTTNEKEWLDKVKPEIDKGIKAEDLTPTKHGYLQWALANQNYYLSYFPFYARKEINYSRLLDIKKDSQELLDEAKNFYKIPALGNLTWDKIVTSWSRPYLEDSIKDLDLITEREKTNLLPNIASNKLNNSGLGDLKTSNVNTYFDSLRNTALNYSYKVQIENLIKIAEYLFKHGGLTDEKGGLYNSSVEKARFEYTIDSLLLDKKPNIRFTDSKFEKNLPLIGDKITSKSWKLSNIERKQLDRYNSQLEDLQENLNKEKKQDKPDEKKIELIESQIEDITNNISKLKRIATSGTMWKSFNAFNRLTLLGYGTLGRAWHFSQFMISSMNQSLDGRLFGKMDLAKGVALGMKAYGIESFGGGLITAGVMKTLVATELSGQFTPSTGLFIGGSGLLALDHLFNKKLLSTSDNALKSKMTQLMLRTGAFESMDFLNEDNFRQILTNKLRYFVPLGLVEKFGITMHSITVSAMMHSKQIVDKKGDLRPLWDAFTTDEDDNLTWNNEEFDNQDSHNMNFTGANSKEWLNFRNKLEAALRKTNGDFSRHHAQLVQKDLKLQVLTELRKWIAEYLAVMLSGESTDEQAGYKFKGWVPGAVDLGKEAYRKVTRGKPTNTTTDEASSKAMNNALFMMSIVTALLVSEAILRQYLITQHPDTENGEEDNKWSVDPYMALNMINRGQSDLVPLLNGNINRYGAVKQLHPAINTGVNVYNTVKSLGTAITTMMKDADYSYAGFQRADRMTHRELIAHHLIKPQIHSEDKELPLLDSEGQPTDNFKEVPLYEDENGKLVRRKYPKASEDPDISRTGYFFRSFTPFLHTLQTTRNAETSNNLLK